LISIREGPYLRHEESLASGGLAGERAGNLGKTKLPCLDYRQAYGVLPGDVLRRR
jgi:hypothetical protein